MRWKPANSRPTILAVQHLIGSHPYAVDFRDLFYYVTKEDLAHEIGQAGMSVSFEDAEKLFESMGLARGKVYSAGIAGKGTYGFFATESVLRAANLDLPPWDSDTDFRRAISLRKHASRG